MNLQEFRFYYPEYDEKSDEELSDALFNTYYQEMGREAFNQAIEFAPPEPQPEPPAQPDPDYVPIPGAVMEDDPGPGFVDRAGAVKDTLQAQLNTIGQPGANESVSDSDFPDPNQAALEAGGADPAPIVDPYTDPFAGLPEVPPEVAQAADKFPSVKKVLDIATGADPDVGALEPALETLSNMARVYPALETAAAWITGMYGSVISGLVGVSQLVGPGGASSAARAAIGQEGELDRMAKTMEAVQETLIYQPKTARGQKLAKTSMYPFEKLTELADYVEDGLAPTFGNEVAALAAGLIETSPVIIPIIGRSKIMKTRSMNFVTERGLKALEADLASFKEANPNLSPGQLARRYKSEFERMAKERQAGERPITEEAPAAKPVKPVEKTKLSPEAPQVQPGGVPAPPKPPPAESHPFPGPRAGTADVPIIPPPDFNLIGKPVGPNEMKYQAPKATRLAKKMTRALGIEVKYDYSVDNGGDFPDFHGFTLVGLKGKEGSFTGLANEADEVVLDRAQGILVGLRTGGKTPQLEGPAEALKNARKEVDTAPTEAQKESGNYKKGHIKLFDYNITLENPKGSFREGVDPGGQKWRQKMASDYGYFKRTEGKDGDQIDVFIGSPADSGKYYIVDQVAPGTNKFDEHKTLIGFPDKEAARLGYLANYEKGWDGLGAISELTKDEFDAWLAKGKQTKPYGDLKSSRAKPFKKRPVRKVKALEERKNLGAALNAIGPIDPLNMRGELKSAGEKGKLNPWKMKFKKGGMPYDVAEQMLKDAGFLAPDESIFSLVLDDGNLKRGRLSGDFEAKADADLTEQEKAFKAEMEHEPEAPPPGPYKQMAAEDLPEGAELTIIDGKSVEGWDHYKVIAKDPFGVTLRDGETIELTPDEIVQVRKADLSDEPAAPATDKPRETLTLKGEQAKSKEQIELKKKAEKGKQATLTTAFEEAKDKAHGPGLRMEGEKASKKEAEAFKKKTEVDTGLANEDIKSYEISEAKPKYQQLQLKFGLPKKPQIVTVSDVPSADTQQTRMVTTGSVRAGSLAVNSPAEAASLLAHLRKSAQEHLYTITADKSGNVLEIHKYSKHTKGSAPVNVAEVVGRIFQIKGADQVYVVHNHPGGDPIPSGEGGDIGIHRRINAMLRLKDINANNLIIADTRFADFYPGDMGDSPLVMKGKIPGQLRNKKIPVKERGLFKRMRKFYGKPANSTDIMVIARDRFPDTNGWILLNNRNEVIGIHEYKIGDEAGQAFVDLYSHIERANASAVIFVNNGKMPSKRKQFIGAASKAFAADVTTHDIIENNVSLGDTGQFKPPGNTDAAGIADIGRMRGQTLKSTGGFAKTDKSKYGGKKKKPTGPPAKPWGADKKLPPIIDLPELVQIAKALGGGDYPKVMKILGRSLSTAGDFRPAGKGYVRIRAMFDSPEAMAKSLAHEIGHWVDYLPDKMIRGRGNILGRLASLKSYMKKSLAQYKGAPAELTPEDRKRLRKQARDILKKENADQLIDEVIEKEMPITPDDVLAIWQSADPATSAANPELYDFIQRASSAMKKAIVKSAMKGVVPGELKKFAKVVQEATGKKIKFKATDEMIRKKYQELIKKEIAKRRLFEADTIMQELKNLSVAYKPFEPGESKTYTKYRFSGVELYADFFSAILNDPYLAQRYAPDAWEAFFNYLDSKPEFRDLYQQILDDIYSGKVNPKLRRTVREGFRKGDDEYFEKLAKSPLTATHLKRDLIDSNAFLLKYIRQAQKAGAVIAPDLNPLYAQEDVMYSMAEVESVIQDFYRSLIIPLRKANIDYDLFGEYIYYRRVVHPKEMGGRAEFANPEGIHPDRAAELMAEIETQVGKDKLMDLVKEFRRIHVENFVERSEQYKIHDKELIDIMRDAVAYATFDVNGFMDTRYGQAVGNHVKKQIGTFRDIKNPVTATLMKDIAFTKFAYRNRAAKVLVKFLHDNFKDQIKPTKKRYVYKGHEFQPVSTRNPDWGTVFYWSNGKLNAYDVPKELAKSVNGDPIGLQGLVAVLRFVAQPYRKLFTELNPGFWIMNIFRDYMNAASKIPGNSIIGFADSFLAGVKPAFKSVYGIPDPIVEEIRRGNPMLITVADWRGMNPEDKQIERLLAQYHMTPKGWRKNVRDPFWRLFAHISNIGRAMERSTKFGSYLYMKKNFKVPQSEIAHKVRHYGGSPSFLTMGRGAPIINNLLLFSNPQIQDYREHYKSYKEDKANYTWKKVKYTAIPKLIMYLGSLGLLGSSLKYFYNQVSDYDLKNYTVVPIGFTKEGKSVYLRIPQDEASRFAGGILWNVLKEQRQNFLTEMADYAGGQVPSLTPGWGTLVDIRQYISGKNPYDYFRGREAIPDEIFKAGGPRAHKAFLKWLAKNNGAGIVYQFQTDDLDRIKTELEQFLGYPIISNIIGRFIKVSDSGSRKQYREDRDEIQKILANERLDITDTLTKYVNGESLNKEDIEKLTKNVDIIPNNLIKMMFRRHGVVFMQNWLASSSNREKAAVLERYLNLERDRQKAMAEDVLPIVGGEKR